jgi:hypothetical protein
MLSIVVAKLTTLVFPIIKLSSEVVFNMFRLLMLSSWLSLDFDWKLL